jgi:hypothetical protein
MVITSCILVVLLTLLAFFLEIKKKHIDIWLVPYLKGTLFGEKQVSNKRHIMFAFCDHYEPAWGRPSYEKEVERVDRWLKEYPVLASKHVDSAGNHPKHSFFYPEEEYRKEHLDKLVTLCKQGFGEIEIHLHHDRDTAEGLKAKLSSFLKILEEVHGAIPVDKSTNKYQFSFIHGNWALDNSRPDGRWCGVNNELKVLAENGCYADFTLPSAPSVTQTKKINSIYYATGVDGCSKSHNDGIDAEVGKVGKGDLLMIQGPLSLNWKVRKFGIFPKIENADIRKSFPPTPDRIDLWVNANVHVKGKPDWIFIKVHTHGTQDNDINAVLGKEVDDMHRYLREKYNDGVNYALHYVAAREMYNIAKAAEAGMDGDPELYRDYVVPRPRMLMQ